MTKLTDWIKRHQVIAFFVITFTISWGLGFSIEAVIKGIAGYLWPLAVISACGPALAGIISTAVTNTRARQGARRAFWIIFAAAWALFSIAFVAYYVGIFHAPLALVMVVFLIASVVAWGIGLAWSRHPAVRGYLSSLFQLRSVGLGYPVVGADPRICFAFDPNQQPAWQAADHCPPISCNRSGTDWRSRGQGHRSILLFQRHRGRDRPARICITPAEGGRQPSHSHPGPKFLLGSLHFFDWQAEGRPVFSLVFWAKAFLENLPGTFLISWFYNRSKGSILVTGIVHAPANTTYAFFPNLDWPGLQPDHGGCFAGDDRG